MISVVVVLQYSFTVAKKRAHHIIVLLKMFIQHGDNLSFSLFTNFLMFFYLWLSLLSLLGYYRLVLD